ncbi:ABC transporter permease [Clostridium grantii]|uniref:Putative ABC transport system permease protein n=1 Tax=Clostridium grantii DSM 8605 TaxID=1121316 RepID=A0A1M5VTB3_9CLOT|nr:ABC transporter permease [Clostridium grantii]SHH78457.1 putative ABC transport system permease protein [Clostridium grantii DSM 8605]
MKKTFYKNLYRDIKKTFSRFLSIVMIIAMGVAFYSGVRATSPDMKKSADAYLKESNFMDFKLVSTMGLTMDDLAEIKKDDSVEKAEGAFSIDAIFENKDKAMVVNVNSLPSETGINKIKVVEGREPENNNEAVVENLFLKDNNLKIGDEIELKSGKETEISEDLNNNKFTIVGSAQSPLYISAQRQLSSVGNGSVRGFVYILADVFESEVYTEIYVKINGEESKDSLLNNDKYDEIVSKIEENLKKLGVIRSDVRYEEVFQEGESKINEEEEKLLKSEKEAQDKFADGYKQLNDAKLKIEQGKKLLQENQIAFDKKATEGEKQISLGKKQLDDSEKNLNLSKEQAATNISSSIALMVEDAKKQLNFNPTNLTYSNQYNNLSYLYEENIKGKDFDSMYNSLKTNESLESIKPYFDIESLKSNFDNGKAEIDKGRKELAQQEKLLSEGKIKLEEEAKKLNEAESEVLKNIEELKIEEEKVNTKIKDGELEIQKNRDKLEDIKVPEWYVLGRKTNVGYETYRQDSERIDNIGKAFPLIFFLVAALVSLTTITRMVQENRIEIGTFKALGYSRNTIVLHYLIYALAASIIGSLLGISFGFRLFPPLIMNAYSTLYAIPNSLTPFDYKLAFLSSIIAILFTTVAAVLATLEELREEPAYLIRPKQPKSGKAILLEKATFIWKRLSFTRKVTARNIFRYKQRFFMTVIGIATCTGLMITGFGIKSGVVGATESQFNNIYRYDMKSTLSKDIDSSEKETMKIKIMEDSNVESVLFAYTKNATIDTIKSGIVDSYIVVTEDETELNKYINLTMKNEELNLNNEGVIITEKLGKLMNKKVGDTFEVNINSKSVEVKIEAITEHYIQHYIYMSNDYYKKIMKEDIEFNGFYGNLKDTSDSSQDNTSKIIGVIEGIGSVSYRNNTYFDFNKTIKSINSVVFVLIASAGVLAFIVIFNLTNININERKRELSTIKLLGFYNSELASYIYRENIILTLIGSLTGIGVGLLLNTFVITTAETNVMMFLRKIQPSYFLYSVLLTISFSIIVNLAMYKEFDKIDMIESLKSAE